MIGTFGCGNSNNDLEDVQNDLEDDEEENTQNDENPYYEVGEVEPMGDRNIEMHEDISPILEELFEEDPKLVDTGDVTILTYVVDRVITADDVTEIKDFLVEEKDYVFESSESEEGMYDLNFSAEILDESYDRNIYVQIFTVDEGENTQRIFVRIL